MRTASFIFGTTLIGLAGSAFGVPQVVNVDFEGATIGDATYVGDDGALSTPTGTTWNSVAAVSAGASGLLDEFGNPTSVGIDISQQFPGTDPASTNVLEDSGISGTFYVVGLLPTETYSVVGYVMTNGGFDVVDANGSQGFQGFGFDFGSQSYDLPGIQGGGPGSNDGDYMRFDNLQPADLGLGVYGLCFNLDGVISGLQIKGNIPAPATLALASMALAPGLRRRRR